MEHYKFINVKSGEVVILQADNLADAMIDALLLDRSFTFMSIVEDAQGRIN